MTTPNPYEVTSQDELSVSPAPAIPSNRVMTSTAFWVATGLLALILLGAPIGAACAYYVDIESIMASGPAMTIASLVLLGLARFRTPASYSWIALTVPVFCLFVFGWIYFKQWSPSEAEVPVARAVIAYATIISFGWPILIWNIFHRLAATDRQMGMS